MSFDHYGRRRTPSPSFGLGRPAGSDFGANNDAYSTRDDFTSAGEYPTGDDFTTVDDALNVIETQWSSMMPDQCVPIKVALRLLDESRVGWHHREPEFRHVHGQLQSLLKLIVNQHHHAFSSALGTFHQINQSIASSQARIRDLKIALVSARARLGRPDTNLADLAASSAEYGEIIDLLDRIDRAKAVPAELDDLVAAKRFLSAVELLQTGLGTVRSAELDGIASLADLRVYLGNHEHSLADALADELNGLLYPSNEPVEDSDTRRPDGRADGQSDLAAFLSRLAEAGGVLAEDPDSNPAPFDAIWQVVQALHNLGRLDSAVHTIRSRTPLQLAQLVERSIGEVHRRHPGALAASTSISTSLALSDFIDPAFDIRKPVLDDVIGTVLARFEAVAERHRAMDAVIATIIDHTEPVIKAQLTEAVGGGLTDLCGLFATEIGGLIRHYLTGDVGDQGLQPDRIRDPARVRPVFRFDGIDPRSVAVDREAVEAVFRASAPGLSSRDSTAIGGEGGAAVPVTVAGPISRPALLVASSVFNMRIMLPPTVRFVGRVGDIVSSPPASALLSKFVQDFVATVFVPFLDGAVTELVNPIMNDGASFDQDPDWSSRAGYPIFIGPARFFAIVDAFATMVAELAEFCDLARVDGDVLARHVTTYYDRCYTWLAGVVSGRLARADAFGRAGSLRLAAGLVDRPDAVILDPEVSPESLEAECRWLVDQLQPAIEPHDIQLNIRVVASLCVMHNSMRWLAARLESLSTPSQAAASLSSLATMSIPPPAATLSSLFAAIAARVIRLLRSEIRCHAAFFVHQFTDPARRPFVLSRPVGRADPEATALASDFVAFDDQAGMLLSAWDYDSVVVGLASFVDRFIVSRIVRARAMNDHGCGRVQLAVLVVRQNLMSMSDGATRSDGGTIAKSRETTKGRTTAVSDADAVLTHSAAVLDLFQAGPEKLIHRLNATHEGRQTLPAGLTSVEADMLVGLCRRSSGGPDNHPPDPPPATNRPANIRPPGHNFIDIPAMSIRP